MASTELNQYWKLCDTCRLFPLYHDLSRQHYFSVFYVIFSFRTFPPLWHLKEVMPALLFDNKVVAILGKVYSMYLSKFESWRNGKIVLECFRTITSCHCAYISFKLKKRKRWSIFSFNFYIARDNFFIINNMHTHFICFNLGDGNNNHRSPAICSRCYYIGKFFPCRIKLGHIIVRRHNSFIWLTPNTISFTTYGIY